MKKKNLCVRIAASVLVCALLASFASCSEETVSSTSMVGSSASTVSGETQKTTAPELPFCEPGTETLTIATMDSWFATKSYNDNLPVYQKFEELTGVKIVWEAIPINDYDQVMGTRLASGQDLPDIFVVPWESNADKLGYDGISMPLNDLIESDAYYLNKLMDKYPEVRAGITSADGNIYAYPGFGEGFITKASDMADGNEIVNPGANLCLNVSMIRQDWLDKLGLEMPTNLDEWYNVLKAFKTQDPNGNGKADEIPVTATFNVRDIYRFGEEFGLYRSGNAECRWDVDENGKVFFKDTTEEFKQTLEYLNKLYSEGLLDVEFANVGYSKTTEKINRDLVGALTSDWISNIPTYNANLVTAGVADANYVPAPSLTNPDGKSMVTNRWSVWKTAAISKDCDNPELAMKWLDFHTLSPEGIALTTLGVEGESYVMENGVAKLTETATNNPDGISVGDYLFSIGARGQLPYPQTKESYEVMWQDLPVLLNYAGNYAPDQVRDPFPCNGTSALLPFTEDETAIRTEIETNITTYCDEMAIKFITGEVSLDQFNEYVQTIDSYGMPELLELHQAAYERYVASANP